MKRIYLLAPLLALLAFGAGDWFYAGQLAQEQAVLKARAGAARIAALKQEAVENEHAVQAALAAQTPAQAGASRPGGPRPRRPGGPPGGARRPRPGPR